MNQSFALYLLRFLHLESECRLGSIEVHEVLSADVEFEV